MSMYSIHQNAAARVIDRCGGAEKTAEMAGVTPSAVYRWMYPKERGGRAGIVPSEISHRLLAAARDAGIDLTPDDFFDLPPARADPP